MVVELVGWYLLGFGVWSFFVFGNIDSIRGDLLGKLQSWTVSFSRVVFYVYALLKGEEEQEGQRKTKG